jgi:hypothetical protein
MRTTLTLLTVLVALPAAAKPHLLEPGTVQFVDYHGAAPINSPPPPPHYTPAPVSPVATHVGPDFFLVGLGLAAGGLVLGGGGFALLYACREGTSCYSEPITVVGWIIAAPGLIPLTIGLIMMYASSGRSGRVEAPTSAVTRWAFGLSPLPGGGGVVSAAARF